MKTLKTTLIATYIILILLLLLGMCSRPACNRTPDAPQANEPARIDTVFQRDTVVRVDTVMHTDTVMRTDTITRVDTVRVEQPQPRRDEQQERARRVGANGKLKVTLLWDFYGDIDLHVTEPGGNKVWFKKRANSATGANLDVDNRRGGRGAAENIAWSNPRNGKYQVRLNYYSKSTLNNIAQAGQCTVVVFINGNARSYRVPMYRVGQNQVVCNFSYHD